MSHTRSSFNDSLCPIALVPGHVENLRYAQDLKRHSVTLNWDKPNNFRVAGDVTGYDIRYRHFDSSWIAPYHETTVNAQQTSIVLTEESALNSLVFEVRAWNADRKGEWSRTSEYIGTCDPLLSITFLFRENFCVQMTLLHYLHTLALVHQVTNLDYNSIIALAPI